MNLRKQIVAILFRHQQTARRIVQRSLKLRNDSKSRGISPKFLGSALLGTIIGEWKHHSILNAVRAVVTGIRTMEEAHPRHMCTDSDVVPLILYTMATKGSGKRRLADITHDVFN
jgi:hypothetical protein